MFPPCILINPLPTVPAGSGGNNQLGLLLPSIGSLSPPFVNTFTTYTTVVPDGADRITLIPTQGHAGQVITVNGRIVSSGTASGEINIPVGTSVITIKCNGGGADKTYTITVTRGSGSLRDAPNPSLFQFNWLNTTSTVYRTLTVGNHSDSDMILNFNAWTVKGFKWITAFPLIVAAGTTSKVVASYTPPLFALNIVGAQTLPFSVAQDHVAGTWSNDLFSGSMEARAKWQFTNTQP